MRSRQSSLRSMSSSLLGLPGRRGARLRDAVAGDVRQAAELLETGLADGGCRTRVLCQTLRRSAENLS